MTLQDALALETVYRLRPRYAETDQMGVVYYANYLVWFECARTEWIRHLGMTYAELERQGLFLPVKRCELEYHDSARYDRPLSITARVRKLTPARVEFLYRVTDDESNALLAEGSTVHAFVDAAGRVSRGGMKALGIE